MSVTISDMRRHALVIASIARLISYDEEMSKGELEKIIRNLMLIMLIQDKDSKLRVEYTMHNETVTMVSDGMFSQG